MKDDIVRTHEPSLRELTAELDGLRELLLSKIDNARQLFDERDKLYKERDDSRAKAVDAALKAAETLTNAAFASSEKAIVKAEEAQKSYNASHNDLARKMDEQSKATMPRTETESRFQNVEEKIGELRSGEARGGGAAQGSKASRDESRSNMALTVAFVGGLVGFIGLLTSIVMVVLRMLGK